ncbi:MAG: UDP-N-acetylglucosamine--N-acetylmuramyl-(pentapeptide) pyrophosphoryl-undecaprenol N-acetylglucosamine transferase [Acidimicrobiales bacterium]
MSSGIVLAGGGTAGHVLPALSIAEALVARGHQRSSIHFVGSRRGQEAVLVPRAGFGVTLLPGRGVQRRLTCQSFAATAGLGAALAMSIGLFARRRPSVVVSVGGYASLPVALAAGLLRIPLVLCNPDAVANSANRLVSRFAVASAVAFEGTALPRATVTGSPIRAEMLGLDRSPAGRRKARLALGLPERRRTIAVFTGSLGSATVNCAVAGLVQRWAEREDLTVRHVIGRRDWPDLSSRFRELPPGGLCYRPVEYEEDMATLLNAADVLVGRAGASTVAEAAAVGLASILVPLPGAPGDHQTANAMALGREGGSIVVANSECNEERLAHELDSLLGDPERLGVMEKAAVEMGHPRAADAIAELVERWAGPPT